MKAINTGFASRCPALVGATRVVASVLGAVAGLVAIYHGYNETLQGSVPTGGILINAIGPPCQGNACLPAMTLVPNFQITGILAIIMGLVVFVWAAVLIQRRRGGVILIVLSVLLLLVGGGYLPPALGIIAGIVGTRIKQTIP